MTRKKRTHRDRPSPRQEKGSPEGPAGGLWVFGDIRNEVQKKVSLSLLHAARDLSAKRDVELCLVLLGRCLDEHLATFQTAGPDRIYYTDHPRLHPYRVETYTGVLESLLRTHRPEMFLLPANDCGRELAPRLAARLDTGLCADCIGLDIDTGTGLLLQTVPAFDDHVHAHITTPHKRPQMATVRPGALKEPGNGAPLREAGPARVYKIPFPRGLRKERVKVLGVERDMVSGHALEDARVVVCGGRGMGTGKRFQSLWDLSRLVGAEVGATRPAVHAHWIEEDCMIGQTGRNVAPEVLLLFGISGAAQFTASIQQAGYIVAVNKDPKAALLSLADLGVVGDVKQVLPELIRRLQKILVDQYGKTPEEVFLHGAGLHAGGLGARLKEIREQKGYRIEEAARALEVSPDEMESVEKNEATPSVSFLLRIAHLFRVDPAPFLSQADGARADKKRVDSFSKRTQSYSYRTLTPGAEQKHLRAFQITIEPKMDHKMVEYRHEGEEFVYVLRGEVDIKVGEEVHHLKRGDNLHFEGSIPHHLRNPSAQNAELIVVLYTP